MSVDQSLHTVLLGTSWEVREGLYLTGHREDRRLALENYELVQQAVLHSSGDKATKTMDEGPFPEKLGSIAIFVTRNPHCTNYIYGVTPPYCIENK